LQTQDNVSYGILGANFCQNSRLNGTKRAYVLNILIQKKVHQDIGMSV
jgi:hypothetical protein